MLSKAEWAMVELAEGIDLEELETRLQIQKEDGETQSDDDDDEGLEDELAKLTADKQMELSDSICPVRLVLVKVSTLSCCHRCEN